MGPDTVREFPDFIGVLPDQLSEAPDLVREAPGQVDVSPGQPTSTSCTRIASLRAALHAAGGAATKENCVTYFESHVAPCHGHARRKHLPTLTHH